MSQLILPIDYEVVLDLVLVKNQVVFVVPVADRVISQKVHDTFEGLTCYFTYCPFDDLRIDVELPIYKFGLNAKDKVYAYDFGYVHPNLFEHVKVVCAEKDGVKFFTFEYLGGLPGNDNEAKVKVKISIEESDEDTSDTSCDSECDCQPCITCPSLQRFKTKTESYTLKILEIVNGIYKSPGMPGEHVPDVDQNEKSLHSVLRMLEEINDAPGMPGSGVPWKNIQQDRFKQLTS